jgi:hypothetical protein
MTGGNPASSHETQNQAESQVAQESAMDRTDSGLQAYESKASNISDSRMEVAESHNHETKDQMEDMNSGNEKP